MARPFEQRIADKIERLQEDRDRVLKQLKIAEGGISDQLLQLENLQASVKSDKLTAADLDFILDQGLHLDTLNEARPTERPSKAFNAVLDTL